MKKEIKEILDRCIEYNSEIEREEAKTLLDYITNLQQALLDIKEYIEKHPWEIEDGYQVSQVLDIVNKARG